MPKILQWITLCLFSSIACASLQKGAEALIQKLDPNAYLGVEVIDLTTGAVLYQRHATDLFIPASNMKLFSDAAALLVLGPDYRFINRLSTDARTLHQGELTGSLYLSLSGDPSFNHYRLQRLLEALKAWHIHKIHGNIVIDSTHAGVAPAAIGWDPKDLAYGYGAPLGPVILDANRLTVTVNPGAQVGSPAIVEVDDPSGTVQVVNQAVTHISPKGCVVRLTLTKQHQLTVSGCVGKGQQALEQELAIQAPLSYTAGVVRRALDRMHISLEGQILLGAPPTDGLLLSKEYAKPVSQLIADTLKDSDNLYADSLFLHAAHILNGSPVDWEKAQLLVKSFLQNQTGIDLTQAVLVDGSGLSRLDRLTPAQTVGLLQFLYQKFPVTYEYIAALPVSGRDGTLASRLKLPAQQDFIRAKTGTMTGINSLSGYLYTKNGHVLVFTIFSNRRPHVNPRVSGRVMIDALCNYFLAQEPGTLSWANFFAAHKRLSFQHQLTQAQRFHHTQARWRGLESAVKAALRTQPVTVLYRPTELVIIDSQPDANRVLDALQILRKQYPFALAVSVPASLNAPQTGTFALLQVDSHPDEKARKWTIREAVNPAPQVTAHP